jgi:hypothetical protein
MSIRLGSFIEAAAARSAVEAKRPSKSAGVTAKRDDAFQGQKPRLLVPMAIRSGSRPCVAAA